MIDLVISDVCMGLQAAAVYIGLYRRTLGSDPKSKLCNTLRPALTSETCQCWGAPGPAYAMHASIYRKGVRSTMQPGIQHGRMLAFD